MRPYPGAVFGRDKTPTSPAPEAAPVEVDQPVTDPKARTQGKGRATPSRREAEQRNRRPLVGASAQPAAGATKEERKAARKARSAQLREERVRQRQAMLAGDERAFPARDRGPVRRWARDYVDARRNLGEYFLPVALIALLAGVVNVPIVRLASLVVLYGMFILIAVDSFMLRRRVQRLADEKFHGKGTEGVGTYAMMRALQFRRGRQPKPVVSRGQSPR